MSEDRFKEAFRRIVSETPEAPSFSDLDTHQVGPARSRVFQPWMAVAGAALLVIVVVGAVGLLNNGGSDLAAPGITTTTTIPGIPENCPVTIPPGNFTPPEGYPTTPSDPDSVWFGKSTLWTVLSPDGVYRPRKSVWWSVNFPGGGEEEQPRIDVTYRLLNDERDLSFTTNRGTNAYTPDDGWFMIAGDDHDVAGCWEVTAVYKGAVLYYIYYNEDGADPSIFFFVPDVVGMTVGDAEDVLRETGYQAAPFDSDDFTYEVCAQEPGAGQQLVWGSVIGLRTAPPGGCAELMNPTVDFNAEYETYSEGFGRTWYRTACPNADVLLTGGVAAADGLPMIGQTEQGRVEDLVSGFGDDFAATYGGSIAAVIRNGEVWDRDADGNVVVLRVSDYMVQITLVDDAPCPSTPLFWNGIPVAFVREDGVGTSCEETAATPGPGEIAVYFNCGYGDVPNPVGVIRNATTQFGFTFEAFAEMLAGPTAEERAAGFSSWFSLETAHAFMDGEFADGHLTLNFSDAILVNNASTSAGSLFFMAELNSNVFAFDEVESVDYLVNGDCVAIWAFVQADPECHTVTRAEWEATQAGWES